MPSMQRSVLSTVICTTDCAVLLTLVGALQGRTPLDVVRPQDEGLASYIREAGGKSF